MTLPPSNSRIPTRTRPPVPRPELEARLRTGIERKLTLISAPAGFGKTDLLVSFAHNCPYPLAWISLNAAHSDPVTFFIQVLNSLRTLDSTAGETLAATVQTAPPPSPEALAAAAARDVALIATPFVLVLDDLHLIENEQIHASLAGLLEQPLPNLHLVVASRVDPALPLARLRAHAELTEIRAADLRFSKAEAGQLLNGKVGLNLSGAQVSALHARTEGWIAGLQLAGIALQSVRKEDVDAFIAGFSGSHRYVMDYLTDEVLHSQPDWVVQFLLATSILPQLSAPLISAVLGEDGLRPGMDSQEVLETIERMNLFLLPLDTERRWYRYHMLFSDLLRRRLSQKDPELAKQLHHRACRWYSERAAGGDDPADIEMAMYHASATGDAALLAQTLNRLGEALWQRGQYTRLGHWLKQVPEGVQGQFPILGILSAWLDIASGQLHQVVDKLAEVERALAASTFPDEVHGKAAVIRAHLAIFSGRPVDAVQAASRSLELLPPWAAAWRTSAATLLGDASSVSGNTTAARRAYSLAVTTSHPEQHPYLSLNAGMKLTMLTAQAAELEVALQLANEQLELANRTGMGKSALAGTLLAVKGQILWERQAGQEGRRMVEEGVQISEQGGHIGMRGWSLLALSRILLASRDLNALESLLERFKSQTISTQVPPWITSPVEGVQALLWLARGELDRVHAWAEQRGLHLDDEHIAARAYEYWAYARYLLASGSRAEAGRLLDRLIETTNQQNNLAFHIQVLLTCVQLALSSGDRPRALADLLRALQLGAPGGFVQLFVAEDLDLRTLLEDEQVQSAFPEYTVLLLEAFDASKHPVPTGELVEQLSNRELEVLERMARGYRNADIARELSISQNTVLFHTKNIFGKLNANNRAQAVDRARQLGIIR